MAKIETMEKGTDWFMIFQKFWAMQKKYLQVDSKVLDTDEYWDSLLTECALFPKEFQDKRYQKFCQNIGMALMDFIEATYKKERGTT